MPAASRLFELMLTIGWAQACPPVCAAGDAAVVAKLTIATSGMRLTIDTQVNGGLLTADDAPELPTGWWEAVRRDGGHCTVIVVDILDLAHPRKLVKHINAAANREAVLIGRAALTTGDT